MSVEAPIASVKRAILPSREGDLQAVGARMVAAVADNTVVLTLSGEARIETP